MSPTLASPLQLSSIALALRLFQVLMAGLCALVLAACGGGGGGGGGQLDAGATLQSITVTTASPNVAKGLYVEFQAVGTWSDGTSRDVSNEVDWASSAPSVVQITNNIGLARGLETGSSVITASMGGVSGNFSFSVTAATLQSIRLDSPDHYSSHLPKGLTNQFVASGSFSDGTSRDITNDVIWASTEPSVATISAAGLATGVASGTTDISATRDGITANTTLTVTSAVPVSLAVTPANVSLPKGLNTPLTATATYSDGISQNVTGIAEWSVSLVDSTKASVSSAGVVTAKNTGTAIVTARLGSSTVQGQATITVTSAELQSIAITPANRSIAKGLNQQFSASGTYSDGSTTNISGSVIWSSENTAVATVVAGKATGVGVGSTGIRATSGSISGNTTLTVTPATLQSITVTPTSGSIAKGLTQQLVAMGHYSDGTSQSLPSLIWSSSDTAVATVNASGLVSALTPNTVQITATSGSFSGSATLTVTPATLQSITVTPASASIAKGLTQQLTAMGHYSDGSSQPVAGLVWSSNTTSVATVNASGMVTGVAQGNAQITATSDNISGHATFTVTSAILKSIAITPANTSIISGLTQQLSATGTYSDGSTQPLTGLTWASSKTNVATVDGNGVVTGMAAGTTQISTTSGNVSSNASVNVTTPVLQSITITPANSNIPKGMTQQLTAMGHYSNGVSQALTTDVIWASDSPTVLAISDTGLVNGLNPGASQITATFNDIHATTNMTITAASMQSIVVDGNDAVFISRTTTLGAFGIFSDGSKQKLSNVTWTSENTLFATVNSSGAVTGVTSGKAQITATKEGLSGASTITVSNTPSTTVLYSFAKTYANGIQPVNLIEGADGNLYGRTNALVANNAAQAGWGVFKITPAGQENMVYSFQWGTTGLGIPSNIAQGDDGKLYGITGQGGSNGGGVFYSLPPSGNTQSGDLTIISSLPALSGRSDLPNHPAKFIKGKDGSFYAAITSGTTLGSITRGHICKVTADGSLSTLFSFNLSTNDSITLIQDNEENLYVSRSFYTSGGYLYKISSSGTLLETLQLPSSLEPIRDLILGNDGNFYGVSSDYNGNSAGNIFRITKNSNSVKVLYSFEGGLLGDGSRPAKITQGNDGYIYGITSSGGVTGTTSTNGAGTVFRLIATDSGIKNYAIIHSFYGRTEGTSFVGDGASPSDIIQGFDGNIYTTTIFGGEGGRLFKITL